MQRNIAVRLLLATLEPSLTFMHTAATTGHVNDPFAEFFIAHDPTVSPLTPALWEHAYTLRHVAPTGQQGRRGDDDVSMDVDEEPAQEQRVPAVPHVLRQVAGHVLAAT